MTSNEELVKELKELKAELQQMKEMVSMLFNMVIDLDDDDEEFGPSIGGIDLNRFNN
ncbi:MAG: hypothetical protein PWQ88_380 [Candidatus Methanomethylophilaceae archaeon]|jgi:predicted nuclease with TOPRIM domain|nr:hypothetical protein [Candidatus Methanomethylophilaceae archaeon]MDI3541109.1 hypothetical protein [Candidatus Methanomethylophilaceae archaeon]HIJ00556.1 50S ribosomal protein L29 [Candidatus Methanomethylophilaceae archaeon]